VSQINGCAYCLHMQTEEARRLGESPTRLYLLDAWHESNLYSDRERAVLAWAESLTNISTTHTPDEVYEQARRQFSEKALADLSIAIAMINAWNRLSIGIAQRTLWIWRRRHNGANRRGANRRGANRRGQISPRRSSPCLSGSRPCMVDSVSLNPAGRRHDSDFVRAARAYRRDAA
jgi:AhpD family alkylhydroperoxidase